MPTTDFFSSPGFEPEDVPVKKTSPAQQPVEKQPADDEPFAGMQKLDFDFLGGDDPAVPGETDPGDPFDDFSFQRKGQKLFFQWFQIIFLLRGRNKMYKNLT